MISKSELESLAKKLMFEMNDDEYETLEKEFDVILKQMDLIGNIKDIDKVSMLLSEVLELHAKLRPDIFISGTTKYTREELTNIFQNDETPVFVAIDNDEVVGYAFCVIKKQPFSTNMVDFKTLHIDDLCVDENCRGKHIGTILYKYVIEYAKSIGCYDVTLNVWEGNDNARAFYEKVGMFVKKTQMEVILK